MNSQYKFYSYGQFSNHVDGMDQGTWQQPLQNASASSGQTDIYYGAPQSYNLPQAASQSGSLTGGGGGGFNTAYSSNTASLSSNPGFSAMMDGTNTNSVYMGGLNNSNSMSAKPLYQDTSTSSATAAAAATGYNYYEGYNHNNPPQEESYSTSAFAQNSSTMGQVAVGNNEMSGFSGFPSQNYNDIGNNMTSRNIVDYSNGNSMCGQAYQDNGSMLMNSRSGNDFQSMANSGSTLSRSFVHKESDQDRSNFRGNNSNFQRQPDWNNDYKMRRGGFHRGDNDSVGWRGRAGGRSNGNFHSSNYNRRSEMRYQSGNAEGTVSLNPTNFNRWGFLRKMFKKRDDELVEHLFELHEKFCNSCQQRHENKKTMKRKKGDDQDETIDEEDVSEEELTEEQMEMKKIMGFSGFKSTKTSKVKDSVSEVISSVNRSKEDEEGTTALTEQEKKRISSIGGYSVFSRNNTQPAFGAPAVTMDPIEAQDLNDTNASSAPGIGEKANS